MCIGQFEHWERFVHAILLFALLQEPSLYPVVFCWIHSLNHSKKLRAVFATESHWARKDTYRPKVNYVSL